MLDIFSSCWRFPLHVFFYFLVVLRCQWLTKKLNTRRFRCSRCRRRQHQQNCCCCCCCCYASRFSIIQCSSWLRNLVTSWSASTASPRESWSLTRGEFVARTDGASRRDDHWPRSQFLERPVRPLHDPLTLSEAVSTDRQRLVSHVSDDVCLLNIGLHRRRRRYIARLSQPWNDRHFPRSPIKTVES